MSTEQYEIEVKSLLGDALAAERFKEALKAAGVSSTATKETQLNHYFEGGELARLEENLAPYLCAEDQEKFQLIVKRGTKVSVRTREVNGVVRFVMKASLGDDSSSNGVVRAELDVEVPGISLGDLDARILAAGYTYQAKWSRMRQTFEGGPVTVCLDKNAGYGYLAEFEKVVDDASSLEDAKAEVLAFMDQVGASELPQDRLERMFAYYNEHWPEYYGTESVFTIQ
ncbi:MAG: hypothetical protein V4480_01265 [Patescibacteria group bacterium]